MNIEDSESMKNPLPFHSIRFELSIDICIQWLAAGGIRIFIEYLLANHRRSSPFCFRFFYMRPKYARVRTFSIYLSFVKCKFVAFESETRRDRGKMGSKFRSLSGRSETEKLMSLFTFVITFFFFFSRTCRVIQ